MGQDIVYYVRGGAGHADHDNVFAFVFFHAESFSKCIYNERYGMLDSLLWSELLCVHEYTLELILIFKYRLL